MLENIFTALLGVSVAATQPGIGDGYAHLIDRSGGVKGYYKLLSADGSRRTINYLESFPSPRNYSGTPNVRASVVTHVMDCERQIFYINRVELFPDPEALSGAIRTSTAQGEAASLNLDRDVIGTRLYKAACSAGTKKAAENDARQEKPQADATSRPGITQADAAGNTASGGVSDDGAPSPPGDREALPTPVAPGAAGSIKDEKPFRESRISLGTLALLSEYVYYEPEKLAFKAAVLQKFLDGYEVTAPSTGPTRVTLDTTKQRLEKDFEFYQTKINQKADLLKKAGLERLSLPKLDREPWGGFYAELYQERSSGETILVFRGTSSPLDWVNNIWLGLDLLKLEAPHYTSARELAQALVRAGRKPMLTGHSLGGGLAQYAAVKFGLRAVAFNSSPLPVRYFSSSREVDPAKIRVYSALEKTPNASQDLYRPDPVSLSVPHVLERANAALSAEYFKAHFHLVKPICVESIPEPFTTQMEDEEIQAQLDSALLTGVLSAIKGGKVTAIADKGLEMKIKGDVRQAMNHPAWAPASRSRYDAKVFETITSEIEKSAVLVYQEFGGSVKAVKGMGQLLMGNYRDGAKTWGGVFANAAVKSTLRKHLQMPHAMSRFNRGMVVQAGDNPFVAEAVRVQCAMPSSLY